MLDFPQPRHLPCPACGESVPRGEEDGHTCEDERRLDQVLFQLREEIAAFDGQLSAWLETSEGLFAAWLAQHGR